MSFKRLPLIKKLFKDHSPKIAFRALAKFGSSMPLSGNIGVFMGLRTYSPEANLTTGIDYIEIDTIADAQEFGNLTNLKHDGRDALSNGSNNRAISASSASDYVALADIDYFNILSKTDAEDFGTLINMKGYTAHCSNSTNDRGLFWAGRIGSGTNTDIIEYVTISTTGSATNFGGVAFRPRAYTRALDNGSNNRGVAASGTCTPLSDANLIEYATISTGANAQSFGNLMEESDARIGGFSSRENNRAIWTRGHSPWRQHMQYVNITSTGNSADFGDCSASGMSDQGTSNGTGNRGIIPMTTNASWVGSNNLEYVNIASLGNSLTFGTLSGTHNSRGATSNC